MNLLLSIVRNIALLALISSFWELLAPQGSLRGTVRLVIGLLLVAAVVLPLSDTLSRSPAPWELSYPDLSGAEESLAQGREIAAQLEQEALSQYEQELARQVAALCLLREGVQQVQAQVRAEGGQGALTQVIVEAELEPGAEADQVQAKLGGMLNTFFAVNEEDIEFRLKTN